MDFLSRLNKIKPDTKPKLKPKEDKRKDFFVILSKEWVEGMLIFYAKCKKKFADKDIPPLTKIFEKQHKCAVSLSISPDDPHILKLIFHQPRGLEKIV